MKKYGVWIVCLLAVLAFLTFRTNVKNRKSAIETFNVNSITKEEITGELVIALFIKKSEKKLRIFIQKIIQEKLRFIIMRYLL